MGYLIQCFFPILFEEDEGITFQKNHNNTSPSSSPAQIYFQKQGQGESSFTLS